MIPKIIHYCWLSDDPIPMERENSRVRVQKMGFYDISKI